MKKVGLGILILLSAMLLQPTVEVKAFPLPVVLAKDAVRDSESSGTGSSSWTDGVDDSIYGDKESTTQLKRMEKKEPSRVEKEISRLLVNIGSGITNLLAKDNLDIDSIIFGRVGHKSMAVNHVSFELKQGNAYGIGGSIFYSILRGIVYAGLSMVFMWYLVGAAWSYSGKGYEKFKSNLQNFLLVFLLIGLMPQFVDIALYVRDATLSGVSKIQDVGILADKDLFQDTIVTMEPPLNEERSKALIQELIGFGIEDVRNAHFTAIPDLIMNAILTGNNAIQRLKRLHEIYEICKDHDQYLNVMNNIENMNQKGILGAYYLEAAITEEVVPSAMYLSMSLLSIYFLVAYVSTAVTMTLAFGFFPLVCLLSFMDRRLLTTWVKTMVSFLITPVVDACLLFLPLFVYAVNAPMFVTFITCMVIIPARSIVRNILGVGGSMGSELLGIGSMMMFGRLAGNTFRGVGSAKTGLGQAWNDYKTSKAYGEAGKLDKPAVATASVGGMSYGVKGMSAEDSSKLTAYNEKRNEILRDGATASNFDSPIFKDALSDTDRSNFYRQRALANIGGMVGRTVGSVAGGGLGLAATMFGGPSVRAFAMGAGARVGGLAGGAYGRGLGNLAGYVDRMSDSPMEMTASPTVDYTSPIDTSLGRVGASTNTNIPIHMPNQSSNTTDSTYITEPVNDNPIIPSDNNPNGENSSVTLFSGKTMLPGEELDRIQVESYKWMEDFKAGNYSNGAGDSFIKGMNMDPKTTTVKDAIGSYESLKEEQKTSVDQSIRVQALVGYMEKQYPTWDSNEKMKYQELLQKATERARSVQNAGKDLRESSSNENTK